MWPVAALSVGGAHGADTKPYGAGLPGAARALGRPALGVSAMGAFAIAAISASRPVAHEAARPRCTLLHAAERLSLSQAAFRADQAASGAPAGRGLPCRHRRLKL